MSEYDQRRAIQKAFPNLLADLGYRWTNGFLMNEGLKVKDPLFDLNLVHLAEKTLTDGQKRTYEFVLCRVVGRRSQDEPVVEMYDFDLLHAPAGERWEAILRTLDFWED